MTADLDVATQLRTSWLGSVSELADMDLQRRTWLDSANRNPHWSYLEFVCSYPDYDQLEQAYREGWLAKRELEILKDLHHKLDAHLAPGGDDYDNAAVLADPAWQAVVAAAEDAKRQLLSIVHDQHERNVLMGAE
ncbi:MAG TPA: hypothetical protein VG651_04210 [Stellaceae bacterium]|nr:hypothetical protein [Stellaceae bacterium]